MTGIVTSAGKSYLGQTSVEMWVYHWIYSWEVRLIRPQELV